MAARRLLNTAETGAANLMLYDMETQPSLYEDSSELRGQHSNGEKQQDLDLSSIYIRSNSTGI